MKRIGLTTAIIVFGPMLAYMLAGYFWIPIMLSIGVPEIVAQFASYGLASAIYLYASVFAVFWSASQFFK